ncbi:unnamed protein product, partial [Ixodes pacificus]
VEAKDTKLTAQDLQSDALPVTEQQGQLLATEETEGVVDMDENSASISVYSTSCLRWPA